jgi:hypothetical protein
MFKKGIAMPTIISAGSFDASKIDTGFSQNHGQPVTTQDVLSSLEKLSARKEMSDLNKLIMNSPQYFKAGNNGQN